MKKKENSRATIGINDEWLENIFDRKLILPNDMKDSEIIKEFLEEFLEKVKLYLQTCCCIIKSDVEKFFQTDDAEDFEDFQKRGLN